MKRDEAAKKAANNLSNFLNSYSHNEDLKVFINEMAVDHRTLQQLFTKLCFQWIERCSQNGFDDRNMHSVKLCKEVMEVVEEMPDKIRCFPFI